MIPILVVWPWDSLDRCLSGNPRSLGTRSSGNGISVSHLYDFFAALTGYFQIIIVIKRESKYAPNVVFFLQPSLVEFDDKEGHFLISLARVTQAGYAKSQWTIKYV